MRSTGYGSVQTTAIGVMAVLLAAACWATSGIFVNLILAGSRVSTLALAFWRDIIGFTIFFILALYFDHRQLGIRPKDRFPIAGMGISLGIFHVVLNLGYQMNGIAITTILQTIMPAIVLIASRIIWKEPLTGLKILSLILICAGTVLVTGLLQANTPEITILSILVGLMIPILYAGWSLFGKALRSGYSAVITLSWAFGIAALILLPCQLYTGNFFPGMVPVSTVLWFCGLIFISTIGGFFTFTFALGKLPASVATVLIMTEIPFAVGYAYFIFGEVLSMGNIIGALLIVTGVASISLQPKG